MCHVQCAMRVCVCVCNRITVSWRLSLVYSKLNLLHQTRCANNERSRIKMPRKMQMKLAKGLHLAKNYIRIRGYYKAAWKSLKLRADFPLELQHNYYMLGALRAKAKQLDCSHGASIELSIIWIGASEWTGVDTLWEIYFILFLLRCSSKFFILVFYLSYYGSFQQNYRYYRQLAMKHR